MKALLLRMKQSVEEERQRDGKALEADVFGGYQAHYQRIMEEGQKEHPLPQRQAGAGGQKQVPQPVGTLPQACAGDAPLWL